MTEEQVNELIILRTLGGPKRFRPKSREELQNELAVATRKLDTINRRHPKSNQEHSECFPQVEIMPPSLPEQVEEEATPSILNQVPSAEHLREVSALATQLEEARVSSARYELQLAESRRNTEALRAEATAAKLELTTLETERERSHELQRALHESRLARERAEHTAATRLGELEALQLELEHNKLSSAAQHEALKCELETLGQKLVSALQEEEELRQVAIIERERAARAENREESVKVQAEGRLRTAEQALSDATKSRDKLQTALIQRIHFMEEQTDIKIRQASTQAKAFEADRRREALETKRRVDAEKNRADRLLNEKRQVEDMVQSLQLELEKIKTQLKIAHESHLDDEARFEAERLTLTEKVGLLENALTQQQGTENADRIHTEVQIDRVARRAVRDRSRFAQIEESSKQDHAARIRAEALEAQTVAAKAVADRRLAQARDEIEALRKKLLQMERRDNAAANQRQNAQQQQKALADRLHFLESDHEATRQALLAHMRLADVYATVHDKIAATSKQSIDGQEARSTRAELAKARAELDAALALSPRLSAFYDSVLAHIRNRRQYDTISPADASPILAPKKVEIPSHLKQSPKIGTNEHSLPEPLFIRDNTGMKPCISSIDDQYSRDADGCQFYEHTTETKTTPQKAIQSSPLGTTEDEATSLSENSALSKQESASFAIHSNNNNSIGTTDFNEPTLLQEANLIEATNHDLESIGTSDNNSNTRPPFSRIESIGDDNMSTSPPPSSIDTTPHRKIHTATTGRAR